MLENSLEYILRKLRKRISDLETGANSVLSVFGRIGAVVAATNDYTWAQVDKTTSDIANIATKDHGSLTGLTDADHTEASLTLADNTTNNASTSKHGFLKKLDNVSTNFMNGAGNWAAPASGGLTYTSTTLGSAASSIQFTGLDLETDGVYWVFLYMKNAYAGANGVILNFNGDTTTTDYYREYVDADSTTLGSARSNVHNIFATSQNNNLFVSMTIMKVAGEVTCTLAYVARNAPSAIICDTLMQMTTFTTNVTTLELRSDNANGWDTGTRAILVKPFA